MYENNDDVAKYELLTFANKRIGRYQNDFSEI